MGGVVAAGHPATARAAARVLEDGGNAVDACVAAAYASFACESLLTGPAAGGFLLVHDARTGEDRLYDGYVAAPDTGDVDRDEATERMVEIPVVFSEEAVQRFHCGAASVAVPGVVAAIAAALEAHGTRPATELVADGIALAREGTILGPQQALLHQLLSPVVVHTPEAASVYEPEGRPLEVGHRFAQPELADTLMALAAEGPDHLYRGPLGRAIADEVQRGGGFLTVEDLAAYRVEVRDPIRLPLRGGRTMLTNPPPSTGGLLIAVALGVLARLGEDLPLAVQWALALQTANRQRTPELAAALAGDRPQRAADDLLAPDRLDALAAEARGRVHRRPAVRADLGSTTHISVLDEHGNGASLTASTGCASGVIVPGTGILLNNMLGESDLAPLGFFRVVPGHRLTSMMAPSMVLDAGGDVELVAGSAGSNRLRSAMTQVIWRTVELGEPVADAVGAPRVHCEGDRIEVEPGYSPDQLAGIDDLGKVVRWAARNWYFGGSNACARTADGRLAGGADPRRGGAALAAGLHQT
jgi:gamma-glutamyltranspeptidase/glutathione hydrolase